MLLNAMLIAGVASTAAAQQPDSSFGTHAFVTTNYYGTEEVYNTVAAYSGNKVVAAGYAVNGNGVRECVVARYLSDGKLDNTFNSTGKVTVTTTGDEIIKRIAIQPDGKILAIGTRSVSPTESSILIMRFTATGALDNTFGTQGKIYYAPSTGRDFGNNIVLQNDGKIVIAGTEDYFNYILARYNADGTPDNSFGVNGVVSFNYDPNPNPTASSEGVGLAIQADGKILVSGGFWSSSPGIAMARYSAGGVLDKTFGILGTSIITSPNYPSDPEIWGAEDIAIAPNGKIYVHGAISSGSIAKQPVVIGLDANGKIDQSFGTSGYAIDGRSGYYAVAPYLTVKADGNILAGGYMQVNGGDSLVLLLYKPDGTPVTSFGDKGRYAVGRAASALLANDVLLQNDGKIVVAGFDNFSNKKSTMLMRIGEKTPPPPPPPPPNSVAGAHQEDGMQIVLYPNPAGNMLNVLLPKALESKQLKADITNVSGQLVATHVLTGAQQMTLDVSMLQPGMYTLSVADDNGQLITKNFIRE